MDKFPRTTVGGVSLSRLIIGSNWLLGYSHTSAAKDRLIKAFQSRQSIVEVLKAFLSYDVDAVMGGPSQLLIEACNEAEQQTGKRLIRILTPGFNIWETRSAASSILADKEPEEAFDACKKMGATFCLPHQMVTDALIDRRSKTIRDFDKYAKMIRARGMIPGLSTHMPEAVTYADGTGVDVETYIQLYNAIGFLMQVEVDWVMRIIRNAQKPVMTIKPLAAGRLLPPVGLAFVWSTIRDQDMVTIGAMTPDEAKESVELSLDFLSRRMPDNELQSTRSKNLLKANP
jgi:hypothetical protein